MKSVRTMWQLWAGDVLIGAYETKADMLAWLLNATDLYRTGESVLRVDPCTLRVVKPKS